ncbi:Uncharacterized protein ALO77_03892 [Pseudomonas coronafaciens pv. garcae]|nr:Uncharacterized protein ALO77_03892 [Pseudomonas coronafaciens pv. garcae]RMS90794.1 hypothetical protein ALP57_01377 [Pseudomonas coronafaciens pv. oryzae]RMV85227.1 hypothetical protein ALP02_03108 [Pseudomonas coronafaciens pv. garcae]
MPLQPFTVRSSEACLALPTATWLLAMPQQISLCRYRYDALDRIATRTPLAKAITKVSRQSGPLPGFNGELLDSITGHYLLGNGYRAYNPVLMRFNSPDSLSPFGKGGLNAYAYCGGDPVNQSDPTGHIVKTRLKLGIRPKRNLVKTKKGVLGLKRDRSDSEVASVVVNDLSILGGHIPAVEKLFSYLKGSDLVSLSQVSKAHRDFVARNVRLLKLDKGGIGLSARDLRRLNYVARGEEFGYLPSQVLLQKGFKSVATTKFPDITNQWELMAAIEYVREIEAYRRNWTLRPFGQS